jgi:hypothetical protein
MNKSMSKYDSQKISWRIKSECNGCPDLITYHDIKDALFESGPMVDFFVNRANKDYLFANENLAEELINILESMSSIDSDDRRRIALVHGMIQYPMKHTVFDKDSMINELEKFPYREERYELTHIFINCLVNHYSEDRYINARENLKLISDITEPGYEEASLFNQFMQLNEKSTSKTRVPSNAHYVLSGSRGIPSKQYALELLFNFEAYDFQDSEWVGGGKEFDYTDPQSLRKRKILELLKELENASFNESLDFLS